MKPLPDDISDDELLAYLDEWAALLEQEDYEAAYLHTEHIAEMGWSPGLIREVIKSYGEARPDQKVTLRGVPTDITQSKQIDRWTPDEGRYCGDIWYDLNINGEVSDLTATFYMQQTDRGLTVLLNDIHVM